MHGALNAHGKVNGAFLKSVRLSFRLYFPPSPLEYIWQRIHDACNCNNLFRVICNYYKCMQNKDPSYLGLCFHSSINK